MSAGFGGWFSPKFSEVCGAFAYANSAPEFEDKQTGTNPKSKKQKLKFIYKFRKKSFKPVNKAKGRKLIKFKVKFNYKCNSAWE